MEYYTETESTHTTSYTGVSSEHCRNIGNYKEALKDLFNRLKTAIYSIING